MSVSLFSNFTISLGATGNAIIKRFGLKRFLIDLAASITVAPVAAASTRITTLSSRNKIVMGLKERKQKVRNIILETDKQIKEMEFPDSASKTSFWQQSTKQRIIF